MRAPASRPVRSLMPAGVPAGVRAGVLAWLTGVLALTGCDSGAGRPGKAGPGPVPASVQRPGDPGRGYALLVDRATIPCGLPYDAYLRGLARAGLRPGQNAGPQFPGRTGRNRGLPYGLTLRPEGKPCLAHSLDKGNPIKIGNIFYILPLGNSQNVLRAPEHIRKPASLFLCHGNDLQAPARLTVLLF